MPGQRCKGERLDEPLRSVRHHDMDIERLALQFPNQLRCLVRGNAAGNADRNLHRTSDCCRLRRADRVRWSCARQRLRLHCTASYEACL